jgi:hypothetical protein
MDQPHVRTASAEAIKAYADWRAKEYGSFSQYIEAGVLSAFIEMLCCERDALRKELKRTTAAPLPTKGFKVARVYLGDVEVWAEYAYDGGEPEVRYYRDGSGHPGSPACVQITDIYLNHRWTRDVSCIDAETVEKWEEEILERETQADRDAESEAVDRWLDERKDRALMGENA